MTRRTIRGRQTRQNKHTHTHKGITRTHVKGNRKAQHTYKHKRKRKRDGRNVSARNGASPLHAGTLCQHSLSSRSLVSPPLDINFIYFTLFFFLFSVNPNHSAKKRSAMTIPQLRRSTTASFPSFFSLTERKGKAGRCPRPGSSDRQRLLLHALPQCCLRAIHSPS